ncbi:MAG: hypothetical protein LBB43_01500 [Spirochaetaceae bacterium]|jgi:hypothetical protein|nr:hypothetical protein [Spirochaetaceae bacterium]
MKSLFICFGVLLFTGCSTLETYIENADKHYEVVPILVEQKLFKPRTVIMGNYSLVRQKDRFDDSFSFSLGSGFYNKNDSNYLLYRENTPVYAVVIASQTVGLTMANDSTLGITQRSLRFAGDSVTKELRIDGADKYLSVNDEIAGTVSITEYKSKNKNDSKGDWKIHTGFTVTVNGEEYGILALYNAGFYRSKSYSGKKDSEFDDRMAIYVLAVYESWNLKE